MEIIITGEAKEIAALVLQLQERQAVYNNITMQPKVSTDSLADIVRNAVTESVSPQGIA